MFGLFGLVRDVLLLGVVLMLIVAGTLGREWVAPSSIAPKIVAVVPAPHAATSTPVTVATTTPLVATTTPKTTPKPVPKTVPKAAPKPVTPTPKVEELNITLGDAIQSMSNLAAGQSTSTLTTNDRVRAALVNIICSSAASGSFDSISGSGVIIDPRGVILTNAHVAQFFLLKDYPTQDYVECVIRTGSPARPMYKAELMFLPPRWIKDNAIKITQEVPTGTGERDFALLRITGAVNSTVTLPKQFPFLLTAINAPVVGEDVLQAGYAAGFLGGITIQNDLYASSAWTKIREVYTFNANTTDLVALGGSIVAQGGSSGGPVTNTDGVLLGVIVTSSGSGDTSTRDLHALTTEYIIRDFLEERGKSLMSVLSAENLSSEVEIFNKVYAPSARQALIDQIEK